MTTPSTPSTPTGHSPQRTAHITHLENTITDTQKRIQQTQEEHTTKTRWTRQQWKHAKLDKEQTLEELTHTLDTLHAENRRQQAELQAVARPHHADDPTWDDYTRTLTQLNSKTNYQTLHDVGETNPLETIAGISTSAWWNLIDDGVDTLKPHPNDGLRMKESLKINTGPVTWYVQTDTGPDIPIDHVVALSATFDTIHGYTLPHQLEEPTRELYTQLRETHGREQAITIITETLNEHQPHTPEQPAAETPNPVNDTVKRHRNRTGRNTGHTR